MTSMVPSPSRARTVKRFAMQIKMATVSDAELVAAWDRMSPILQVYFFRCPPAEARAIIMGVLGSVVWGD